jgi:hypothetical protein
MALVRNEIDDWEIRQDNATSRSIAAINEEYPLNVGYDSRLIYAKRIDAAERVRRTIELERDTYCEPC